jgi:1-acyl-sn-glycerol-3-phosphate acyltransferase
MIGWLRASAVLLLVALVTPPLGLLQLLAVRTGWFDDRVVPNLWHRLILKMLGLRLHVTGEMSRRRPLLLAANHISWTDIMVVGAAAKVNFIAKSEVSGWPGIGILAHLQRTVFVERESRRKSGEQAGEIAGRLRRGDPMVLFAEGSTGDGNLLLPFKSTLFGAASMAFGEGAPDGVAIQPIAIAYTRFHGMPMGRRHRMRVSWVGDTPLLPHLLTLIREGATDVEVHFGEPVEYGGTTGRKAAALEAERRVRDMFVNALRQPRPSRGG